MSLVKVFYLNQDATWQKPAMEVSRQEVRDMKAKGLGRFVNHGQAFQLFKSAPTYSPTLNLQPQPDLKDKGHDGYGRESCRPDEPVPFHGIGVMSRAVNFGKAKGDPKAKAIIRAWKFAYPIQVGAL